MTSHQLPGQPPREPAPAVEMPSVLRVGAGSRASIDVLVTNTAGEPRRLVVLAVGVDSAWLPAPERTPVLGPGETTMVPLVLTPTAGTLPAQYPLVVTVQSLLPSSDPSLERASSAPTGMAECTLVVNPRARLELDVAPAQATIVRSERMLLTLRNEGTSPVDVELDSTGAKGLEVRLRARRVTVPAGGTAQVRGKLVATRPRRVGATQDHAWSVTASTAESVKRVRGSVRQRPLVGPAWVRGAAILAVVAVWAAAAIVFIPTLADRVNGNGSSDTATLADGDG